MRIFWTIGAMIIFLLGLFYLEGGEVTREQLTANMSSLQESTFNITNNAIPYTDLYAKEPNAKDIFTNLAHGIIYQIMVEINTVMPSLIYIMANKSFIISLFWWTIAIVCLIFIIPITKFTIILYFFIKEKKKNKTKWYQ